MNRGVCSVRRGECMGVCIYRGECSSVCRSKYRVLWLLPKG